MALMGKEQPTDEDVPKLHAEINQLVNQRFLLTTLAITVFALVIAWLIPREPPLAGSAVSIFTIAACILLNVLLFALYLYMYYLKAMMRIYTTYLLVTGKSSWEADWIEYRKEKYFGYMKAQTMIFLLLGLISTAYPFVFAVGYSLYFLSWRWIVADLAVGIIYIVLLWGMGFCSWWDRETTARKKWEALRDSGKKRAA